VEISYFGHACLLFEWGKTRLLCDPWTSERGAFHAAWFQYPEVTEVAGSVPRDPTHLYVSHEHQDHFDPSFLKGVNKETQFLVSDHPSPWVRRGLGRMGFRNVRILDSRVPIEVDGARLAVIASDDPGTPDSALWIEQGGTRYFNQNDCEFTGPFLRGLKEQFPADVHFVQYAPANWFPMVYDYPEERKRAIYPSRRKSRLDKFVNFAAAVDAPHVVGFAGPAAFLDPAFLDACLPSGGIMPGFGDPERALSAAGLRRKVVVPLPGDRLDGEGQIAKRGPYDGWDDSPGAREEYLNAFAARKAPKVREELDSLQTSSKPFGEELAAHLRAIAARAPYLAQELNTVVRFVISDLGEAVTLDATRRPAVVATNGEGHANYTITTESRFLRPLVAGDWNWDWFLLSMRFKAHRDPDEYNPWIQYFLSRSTPREARLIEDFVAGEVYEKHTVEAGGARYEIERWCPHARGDLARGTILGRVLQCPVHHMRYDLDTGACDSKGVRALRTKRL
jgi:UDP-MurNAc hydroxylase